MAIGRTFEESFQKALRMVDPSISGYEPLGAKTAREGKAGKEWSQKELEETLMNPTDERVFALGTAMLERGYSVDRIHELTKIDKWFLHKLKNIADTQVGTFLRRGRKGEGKGGGNKV
jgi:carbamoyl-phosphate synthase large subunit